MNYCRQLKQLNNANISVNEYCRVGQCSLVDILQKFEGMYSLHL
jgi:hypothetical protein